MCQGRRAEVLVPPSVPPASWASVGVAASPGAPHRGWEGGSSEAGTGNDIGTAQSVGPSPWVQVGLLRQPLPRGRRGGRAACRSRREQQLQLGCNV